MDKGRPIMSDGFKFCALCNESTIHTDEGCMICEQKRKNAARFFNAFDFDKCDRATLKAVKHVISTKGLSFD